MSDSDTSTASVEYYADLTLAGTFPRIAYEHLMFYSAPRPYRGQTPTPRPRANVGKQRREPTVAHSGWAESSADAHARVESPPPSPDLVEPKPDMCPAHPDKF
ncbi:hypothetical protein CcaverHIS002_0113670 [Cutaneotrichosporon cavernicola]|uniref:Uncharacterized protein n=1 Tax=Cutaneotrichosporon cavernicola TaxID=279322 RepID=A0AA48ICY7_9TREE|nr:uncharacterized protein CcaverHIS019_0113540 [Cutaneotrichosporon cavernicola]BEI80838.1 hypothetical protein CcaverHIS002_0113670 [Cutaneotrichosporon cavernicola]BEI88636.1 hypothetical protein CcaverHIS019_0113540 [Cutaneotrichosporon cavernicola]BEI96409.1 hypothetical protein CcaverHIS631_0113580 [Cutaneotrichosporon cavernicola]BEJ04181.1 hypothetical protein CcaverHIS641_0113560 [Cutaneotrichosporon cavernicola]